MENNTTIEWFNKLQKDGILPTKAQVIETVSTSTKKYSVDDMDESFLLNLLEKRNCRNLYIEKYCWSLMTQEVVSDMAKFLDGKTILEVCAGNGYIAKCITDINPNIEYICTDSYDWQNNSIGFRSYKNHFFEVEQLDAINAINKYRNVDYIMMSWPPYEEPISSKVLEECIRLNIPLIYIGESENGCTGDMLFHDIIRDKCTKSLDITTNYVPFSGIHDDIYLIKIKEDNVL